MPTPSAALTSIANHDMRLAREEGAILIAKTRHGLLNLSAVKSGRRYVYTLTVLGMDSRELADGSAAAVRSVLIDSYNVVGG